MADAIVLNARKKESMALTSLLWVLLWHLDPLWQGMNEWILDQLYNKQIWFTYSIKLYYDLFGQGLVLCVKILLESHDLWFYILWKLTCSTTSKTNQSLFCSPQLFSLFIHLFTFYIFKFIPLFSCSKLPFSFWELSLRKIPVPVPKSLTTTTKSCQ